MVHQECQSCREIGELIRKERKKQGLTQLQLSGVAGTGVRFLSDLENGKPTAELEKVLLIVRTLGLGMFIYSPWENE